MNDIKRHILKIVVMIGERPFKDGDANWKQKVV